jgi:hypothetical protein
LGRVATFLPRSLFHQLWWKRNKCFSFIAKNVY